MSNPRRIQLATRVLRPVETHDLSIGLQTPQPSPPIPSVEADGRIAVIVISAEQASTSNAVEQAVVKRLAYAIAAVAWTDGKLHELEVAADPLCSYPCRQCFGRSVGPPLASLADVSPREPNDVIAASRQNETISVSASMPFEQVGAPRFVAGDVAEHLVVTRPDGGAE